jgi:pimeloyl-ACP methyl ester carboxylesterase
MTLLSCRPAGTPRILSLCAALTLALAAGCAGPGPQSAAPAAPAAETAAEKAAAAWPAEAAPVAVACPEGPPAGARCLRGKDSAGAPYLIVVPERWSGNLFVHAHGGPFLGAPTDARANEDIKRWSVIVREGHAYAASVFRQGGFAVTTAAEDTERVRRIFVAHVDKPRRTFLHGQSWGGMVAARAAELYPRSWAGILFTSAVVAGPATYDFRLDIRAVYQHLCKNHPRADEPQYPLALGLPAGSTMTNAQLAARVNECLGLDKPAAGRTPEQRARAKLIADVIRVPEKSILSHLNWGTFTLADVTRRHGGAPIGNTGVRYSGSPDDAALNAALDRAGLRFAADPAARARFVADVDHQGRFAVPVVTTHGIHDSTVFVEGSDTLRARMVAAGNGQRLVQTFVDSPEHSYLGEAVYPPLLQALITWVDTGRKPTPASIAGQCRSQQAAAGGAAADCRFVPDHAVKTLASRIPVR